MPPTRRTSLGRRTRNTASQRNIRANQSDEQREARNELERNRYQDRNVVFNPHRAAFSYNVAIDYSSEQIVAIGLMNIVCPHCKALKFKNEGPGLCCASGQVKLTPLIQGQIYHRTGSLLPMPDEDYKFLQIYFMGNSAREVDQRCAHNNSVKRSIVEQLQTFFHQHNELVALFTTALDRMPSDDHKIVIRADKAPAGQHAGRFNAPTIDEVAIVVVGENLENRDIVLHRRNDQLQRVSETHRSYDALQYPILFWQGEDGYNFSMKMINPVTGADTNKKVSSMNYYSYRLMVRENEDNHILICRRLFHQYAVDMYVKVETERLTFIRLNQAKLRSEEYIHLRDAINADGNAQNVGRTTILPATSEVRVICMNMLKMLCAMYDIMAHQICLSHSHAIQSGQKFNKNYFLANHPLIATISLQGC
ncbi:unnamed protein product [Arctia plantaginis]|uniref:Helitron helicase-like domain-containing protein n=1 Tax=Arctia plantaginis TaxID=874455 RepID=A0A8S0ZGG0_ARCPL|nr:unnamed protein product [Arctia plantaginis]